MSQEERAELMITLGGNSKPNEEKKDTMIDHIQKKMQHQHFPCEWRIELLKQKHIIEIVVMIPVELGIEKTFTDRYGKRNTKSKFVFEDTVLLYDARLAEIKDDNYITTLSFDEPDGFYGGTIEAICKNLRLTVGEAIPQLNEFIHDDDQNHFELNWNEDSFQTTIKTLKDTGRFDYTIYAYPLENTGETVEANEME